MSKSNSRRLARSDFFTYVAKCMVQLAKKQPLNKPTLLWEEDHPELGPCLSARGEWDGKSVTASLSFAQTQDRVLTPRDAARELMAKLEMAAKGETVELPGANPVASDNITNADIEVSGFDMGKPGSGGTGLELHLHFPENAEFVHLVSGLHAHCHAVAKLLGFPEENVGYAALAIAVRTYRDCLNPDLASARRKMMLHDMLEQAFLTDIEAPFDAGTTAFHDIEPEDEAPMPPPDEATTIH